MVRPLVKLLVQPTRIIRSHVIRILGRQERGPRSITKTGCEDRPILIKDASDGCHFRCCCCVFCREPLQNQGYFFSQVDLLIPQLRTGTEKVSTVSFSQKESKESRAAGLLGRSGRGIDHIQLPLFRSMVLLPALYFTHLCYTKLVPLFFFFSLTSRRLRPEFVILQLVEVWSRVACSARMKLWSNWSNWNSHEVVKFYCSNSIVLKEVHNSTWLILQYSYYLV